MLATYDIRKNEEYADLVDAIDSDKSQYLSHIVIPT
jgi:hypothetical protein